eukprot:gene1882-3650_t
MDADTSVSRRIFQSSKIHDLYVRFFAERDDFKRSSYQKVIYFGWSLVVLGFGITGISTLVGMSRNSFSLLLWIPIVVELGCVLTVIGILIFSTVPADEFDIDTTLSHSKNYRFLNICAGFGTLSLALVLGIFPPYLGFIISIPGFWIILDGGCKSTINMVLQPNLPITDLPPPDSKSFPNYNISYKMSKSLSYISNPLEVSLFEYSLSKALRGIRHIACACIDGTFNGWPVTTFGATFHIPNIIILIFGRKKVFSFMAKRFELNINRLQKDGAFMAELISSSKVIDYNDIYWINRKNEDNRHIKSNFGDINKSFYMTGNITDIKGDEIYVKISYLEDKDPNSILKFEGDSVIETENSICLKPIPDTYDIWKERNFNITTSENEIENESNYSCDNIHKTVIIKQKINGLGNSELLLKWARENLRRYKWPGNANFNDQLLLRSPRQYVTDKEKEEIYSLSEFIEIKSKYDQIDYFISHSWSDIAVDKCMALKQFSHNFQKHYHREPTYWFDKVCINQKNPGNSLLVLPINIGACKKMLVILGHTYIYRLWCVWELFTLFCFCNKELAMDRLEVLLIGDEASIQERLNDLENFNINKAHCFDPNEELKLRRVIHDVGIERFLACLKQISTIIRVKQQQHSPYRSIIYTTSTTKVNINIPFIIPLTKKVHPEVL